MKRILILTSLMLIVCISAQAQSLDKVLENHFDAVGQEKLAAIQSFVLNATMSQMGMDVPMIMKMKKPDKFRMEIEMQGQKMIQAFDGEKGWMIAPWISSDPQDLSGDELKSAMDQADMEGELYNYEKKGHSAELIGKVNSDGTEAYRIKLTTKDGTVKNYFIDAKTYLVIKTKATVNAMGQSMEVETKMMDYKEIDGIKMAMKMESSTPMGTQTVILEEVKLNEKIDDSIFGRPTK